MKKIIYIVLLFLLVLLPGCISNEQVVSKTVNVGDIFQLKVDEEKGNWTSSDETIAYISENGIVTALSSGNAVISCGNQKINLEVLNEENEIAYINVSNSQSIYVGESIELKPTLENVEEAVGISLGI